MQIAQYKFLGAFIDYTGTVVVSNMHVSKRHMFSNIKHNTTKLQDSHAFVNKKFSTFSIPKFAQNKLSSSHLKYTKLQLF